MYTTGWLKLFIHCYLLPIFRVTVIRFVIGLLHWALGSKRKWYGTLGPYMHTHPDTHILSPCQGKSIPAYSCHTSLHLPIILGSFAPYTVWEAVCICVIEHALSRYANLTHTQEAASYFSASERAYALKIRKQTCTNNFQKVAQNYHLSCISHYQEAWSYFSVALRPTTMTLESQNTSEVTSPASSTQRESHHRQAGSYGQVAQWYMKLKISIK